MDEVKGLKISKLGFKPLKLGDFLYHEGPLLSHFTDADNLHEHYIYKWTDSDDVVNRWLISKCSDELLADFLNRKITLRHIISQNAFVYLLDLDNDLNENHIAIANINDIPESYLPTNNSFFNEKQYEKYASELKNIILNTKNSVAIDHVLSELYSIKKQQFETNNLLESILKRVYSSQDLQGQVAEDSVVYEPESSIPPQ